MSDANKKQKSAPKTPSFLKKMRLRWQNFIARTPHRSFRLTRRREYARTLELPGYWSFTAEAIRTIRANKRLLLGVALVYGLLSVLAVGMISQEKYAELGMYLDEAGKEVVGGDVGGFTKALVVFSSAVMGDLSGGTLSDAQQLYSALLAILCWLTVVWLLRQRLAGHFVKLRDALYNAGAPIVATFIVILVIMAQLLPVAIGLIGMQVLQVSDIAQSGVEAMVVWFVMGLLVVLSLYWTTASLVAMVLVTIPGMYPFQALKEAGELVLGRRLRLMLRLVWLLVSIAVTWVVVLFPIILIDRWLKIEWLPLVPVATVAIGAMSIIWAATYVYLLYRRLIDAR